MREPCCRDAPELLIVGASVRAALQSARWAGINATGADLFADRDAAALAPLHRVVRYPHDFVSLAERLQPAAVMYTGALENHPRVVSQLAQTTTLLGNGRETLAACRNPESLRRVFRDLPGVRTPHLALHAAEPPLNDQCRHWLRKPFASAGGRGIELSCSAEADLPGGARPAAAAAADAGSPAGISPRRPAPLKPSYWQQYVAGIPLAAAYLATRETCHLIGVSRQLIGLGWLGGSGFHYCGSIGPLTLSHDPRRSKWDTWRLIGEVARDEFSLRGLFGIDGIDDGHYVWPIEVNPRYTASMELFESRFVGKERSEASYSLVACHVQSCRAVGEAAGSTGVPLPRAWSGGAGDVNFLRGKAIVHAQRPILVSQALSDRLWDFHDAARVTRLGDVPNPGTHIDRRQPVATILTELALDGTKDRARLFGQDPIGPMEHQLRRLAAELQAILNESDHI